MNVSILKIAAYFVGILSIYGNITSATSAKSFILEISFASTFEEDTVSIDINNCPIVSKYSINTNLINGLADLQITVFGKEQGHKISIFNESDLVCKTIVEDLIVVDVNHNNSKERYYINPENGKYIIFFKRDEKLLFEQYFNRPIFD